jgi:hypothetical protein
MQIPLFSTNVLLFGLGFILYFLFHRFVYQSVSLYVLAHEMTHAVFAVFQGARVKKIKVTAKGGYVEMSESNLVIDLAPYFFPLYAIILSVLFLTLDKIWNLNDFYWLFFFSLGICMSFHYLSSWDVLKIEQPDMAMTGKFFGIIFVLIVNLIILNIIVAILFLDYVNLQTIWENIVYATSFWRDIIFL